MLGNRGSMWSEWFTSMAVLAGAGVILIILIQVYEETLYDEAIEDGVDVTNLNFIDKAWEWITIPIVLAIVYGMIRTGLSGSSGSRSGYG